MPRKLSCDFPNHKSLESQEFEADPDQLACYYVDILKDDLCNRNVDGWYTVKEIQEVIDPTEDTEERTVDEPLVQNEPEPIKKELKSENIRRGPWTEEEHQLFLEALRLYGKDWESIACHVGTRNTALARAHG